MNVYQRITEAIACPACDNSPISKGDGYHLNDQGAYTGDCRECGGTGVNPAIKAMRIYRTPDNKEVIGYCLTSQKELNRIASPP